MDRPQREDEKIGAICLAIFTPRVMVINANNISFFLFSVDDSKKSLPILPKYLKTSKRSY